MGTGGSVGSGGVLAGGGVSEGAGGAVGEKVVDGGAVGAAVAGAAVGPDVRVSGVAGAVATGLGRGAVSGAAGPVVELASGDAVAVPGRSLGAWWLPASRVRLNPASATATASDGPRSTYRVKEARLPWPSARSPGFPTCPPTPGRYFLPSLQAG